MGFFFISLLLVILNFVVHNLSIETIFIRVFSSRVLETIEVSPHFHSRHLPQWRQYLYRFAVLNNASLLKDNKTANRYVVPLPITEAFRCHFV